MRGGDGGLHIARGAVDIAVNAEGELNARGADAAGGGHVIHVGNGAEVAFQWSRNRGRHDFRAGAGKLRRHEYRRYVDARQGSDRQ